MVARLAWQRERAAQLGTGAGHARATFHAARAPRAPPAPAPRPLQPCCAPGPGPQILENVIRFKWGALPDEQREGIKNFLSNLVISYTTDEALFRRETTFVNKLNIILVQILKHDWPARWKSFIPDIVSASKTSETLCENSMKIFKLLSEEVFDFARLDLTQARREDARGARGRSVRSGVDRRARACAWAPAACTAAAAAPAQHAAMQAMPAQQHAVATRLTPAPPARRAQAKTKELKTTLNNEFRLIHEICVFVLCNTRKPDLIRATLDTLSVYLTWVPLGYIFESNMLQILLQLFPQPAFRNVALQVRRRWGALRLLLWRRQLLRLLRLPRSATVCAPLLRLHALVCPTRALPNALRAPRPSPPPAPPVPH